MTMGEHEARQFLAVLGNEGNIGENDINAGVGIIAKFHAERLA